MSEPPHSVPGRSANVPGAIKIVAFLSFSLSIGVILLIHHYLTTWKCPIPQ